MSGTIAVLVRRLPDAAKLQVDRRTGKLLTEGVPFVLNPVDRSALEMALRLKDEHGHRVVVLTVDEGTAEFELREALAMGSDEAILVSDPKLDSSDPTMHANLFRLVLEHVVHPEIVVAAARSDDNTWSTVGPQLAALLYWPLIIEAEDLELEGQRLRAHAHTGAQRAHVEAPLPCVVTVARHAPPGRHATSWGVTEAFDAKKVHIVSLGDMDLDAPAKETLTPRTATQRVSLEPPARAGKSWEGTTEQVGRILSQRLADLGFAGRRS